MHCLIFCIGTDGDCFPLFTLARRLRSRGHRVTVVAPPIYSGFPILEDIGFEPLCTISEYERFVADATKLAGRYGLLVCRQHAVPWNLRAWHTIESLNAHDLLVLGPDHHFFWADVAANMALGCAAVRFRIELPRITYGPSLHLQAGKVQLYLGAALAMEWYGLAAKAGVPASSLSFGNLNGGRRNIATIALYPEWLIGEKGEERNVRYFGFLLPEPDYQYVQESDIPPMKGHAVFKRGLTDSWPDRFCSTSVAVCRKLDMPGWFLGGPPLAGDLSADMVWSRFVPLHRALEGARVIVHNGGIGTAALAIKYGVPQIIIPRTFLQPANAEWIRRLGVASVITSDGLTVDALCREINRLTAKLGIRKRLQELSSRIDSHADSARICEFLESLSTTPKVAPSYGMSVATECC